MVETDIVDDVKTAEAEVVRSIKAAEEQKRKATALAEEKMSDAVAEAKTRAQRGYMAAVEKAKAESAELERNAGVEAKAAAEDLKQVPQDRLSEAVERVAKVLQKRWRSTG